MKRLLLLVLPAVVAAGLVSCKEDPIPETPMITIDGNTDELTAKELTSSAQEFTINVLANGKYTVSIPSAAQLWLEEVKEASTRALSSSKLRFKVKANTGLEEREAIITLTRGNFSQKYRIVQSFSSNALTVEIADMHVKEISERNENNIWTIGIKSKISNKGADIALNVGPTGAFRAWVDESTPWLKIQSSPGNRDVNIQVQTTYNIPSDPVDYSENRVGVVHFESLDKQSSTRVIFMQAPRVAGLYTLEESTEEPTSAATSQLGKQLLAEVAGYRAAVTTLKIVGPMTKYDWQALAFFDGPWLTDTKNLNNIAPLNMSVLDLSEATFDTIPENVFNRSFNNTNSVLKKIILPEGVKVISKTAFQYLAGLEEVNIPSTVEYIGDNAFINTTSNGYLKAPIVLPRSLKYLGVGAFEGNKLSGLSFEEPDEQFCKDGVSRLKISDRAFFAPGITYTITASARGGSLTGDLVIPEWVNSIGVQAFFGLYYQTPASPLASGAGKTVWQTSATNATIKIGSNVESIGYGAFAFNMGVTKFDFGTGKDITIAQYSSASSSSGVQYGLFAKTGISEMTWPIEGRKITLKNATAGDVATWTSEADGIVSLPSYIFASCTNLRKVTVKHGITLIGRGAFYGTSIGSDGAGNGRVKLDALTLPTSLVEFGYDSFNNSYGVGFVHLIGENDIPVLTSTSPGLWDLRQTALTKLNTQALYYIAQNPYEAEPVGQAMTEIRFPSTINNFQNYALYNNKGLTGSKIYLPDGFARGANGVPTGATTGAYIVNNVNAFQTDGNSTNYPTFVYVPLEDWDTIDYDGE